ncbi:hypothetical protein CR513_12243, partial [Mucuna pruriens]
LFVKGKKLWGHIDGSDPAPKEKENLGKWEILDACVMTWIISSVEPHIILNLRPYKTYGNVELFKKDNTARRFQLEHEIANYTQGSLYIEEYYSSFQTLRGEYSDIVQADIPIEVLSTVIQVYGGTLEPIPSLEVCLSEVQEERIITQADMEHKATASHPINYQCYSCKRFGHITKDYSQNFVTTANSEDTLFLPVPYNASVGNSVSSSQPCYFDSGAPNHITNTTAFLSNVWKYDGTQKIHTADGNSLPTKAVGDISPSLTNVLCLLNQVSGKIITKQPKIGRLFPIQLSSSTCSLSHPNSYVLGTLLKSGSLGNKDSCSLNVFFDCITCKLGKKLNFLHIYLRFDSSGEYMSNEFQIFLQDKGIISRYSCPSTPQQIRVT